MHTCSPRQHLGSRGRRVRNPRLVWLMGDPAAHTMHARITPCQVGSSCLGFQGPCPAAGRPAVSEQNNEMLLILLGGSPEEGKDSLFQPRVPPTALVQTRAAEIGLTVLPGDLITGWGWETLSSFLWGRLFQKLKLAAEIRRSRFVLQLPEARVGVG